MTHETASQEQTNAGGASSRRKLLKLGALAAPAVVTLKPAMAQHHVSMAMCRIPIDTYVKADGRPTDRPGKGFAPPPDGYYLGEDLLRYRDVGAPAGVDEEQFQAHLKYIRSLRPGDDGFTCLTSLIHKL
jgi:hypothetical protein